MLHKRPGPPALFFSSDLLQELIDLGIEGGNNAGLFAKCHQLIVTSTHMSSSIRCPNCSFEFEPSEALSSQLRKELQAQFEAESRVKEEALLKRDSELKKKELALEQLRSSVNEEVQSKLAQERDKLLKDARVKVEADLAVQMQDMQEQLSASKKKLDESLKTELELRKCRRELEDQKRELELTVNRKLDEERAKIIETAKKEEAQQRDLKEAEKDKLIEDMKRQIDDLKRKSEQGSQQTQGEVLELELEEMLRRTFPFDTIEPVPKGTHGGDVLQIVHDSVGTECGRILWESKRTKNWSDGWLPKLRDDQRAAKAQFAVLASIEMPKGCSTFTLMDGIWVTNRACIAGVATALRAGLIEVSQAKRAVEGQQGKMELLYKYLSGPEFRHRVEGVVEAFVGLKADLDAEKKAMQRIWAKREKQLERAIASAAGLHGDLGGIIGGSLQAIESLSLLAISHSPSDADANSVPERGEVDGQES